MSKWLEVAEVYPWHGASAEECCGNCVECEHCAQVETDGNNVMILCNLQD